MKSLSDIRRQIQPALTQVERFRLEKVEAIAQGKKWYAIPIILIVLAALTAMMALFPFTILFGIVGLIGFFLVAYYKVQPHQQGYLSKFKEQIFSSFVQSVYEGAYYAPANYLPSVLFRSSELFGGFDNYSGEDYFEGKTENGSAFKFSELKVTDTTTTTDSDGNRETRTTTVFNGLFFVLDAPNHTYGKIHILPDRAEGSFGFLGKLVQKSLGSFFQVGKMVYMNDHPEFEKEFVIYSSDEEEARHVLTPSLLQAIYDLRYKWNASIRFSFIGNAIYVALSTNKDFFKPNINQSLLDDKLLHELYDELALCFAVVEDLSEAYDGEDKYHATKNESKNPFNSEKKSGDKNNGNPFLL